MRQMKDSGIKWMGMIPVDWTVERVKYGFVRKKAEAHQTNPVVLSLARSGVKERDVSNNEGQIAESYYNYNPVDVDDLLINPMDLYSGANCSISKVKGVISPAYVNLRYKEGYNPEYYDYYFKIQYWMMAFFAHGKGVSFDNRWTLNAETLMNYPIIVPSYDEQCKRVDYLKTKCSQIDSIIEKQEAIIEKLKEYKLSVITEAVTKGLDPNVEMKDSGIPWIGVIPKHWKLMKVKYVLEDNSLRVGPFGSSFTSRSIGDGDCFVYGQANVIKRDFSSTKNSVSMETYEDLKDYQVRAGDMCFSVIGNGTIGWCKTVPLDIHLGIMDSHLMKARVNNSIMLNEFFEMVYSKHYSGICHTQMQYEKTGIAMEGLNSRIVKNLWVIIPPVEEQQRIVAKIQEEANRIDERIQTIEALMSGYKEYKKSLIYEVVTGKKEV